MATMQRLRGSLYLKDGAIGPEQLTADGRHKVEADERAWHLLSVGRDGSVQGCARYISHEGKVSFKALGVSRSPMAKCNHWGRHFRHAVQGEITRAQRAGLSYVEVGGWALSEELRHSTEAIRIALASYALAEILGGCIGITTATFRHHSASILRRIGGSSLQDGDHDLPAYYDPNYKCEMEVLRFDSRMPNPRYAGLIQDIRESLATAAVYCPPSTRVAAHSVRSVSALGMAHAVA
ncbi:MAG TPA: hypothetical protein VM120_00100 [Bryobacteraceae bacterium]|nr:hypothetical protein [Bryobacteraceae bacterium]